MQIKTGMFLKTLYLNHAPSVKTGPVFGDVELYIYPLNISNKKLSPAKWGKSPYSKKMIFLFRYLTGRFDHKTAKPPREIDAHTLR